MTNRITFLGLIMAFFGAPAMSHTLKGSAQIIIPERSIETADLLLTLDFIPSWLIDQELRHFWPHANHGVDYSAYTFLNKETGNKRTTLIDIEGGSEPYFEGFSTEEYCGVSMLFITIKREPSRYGGGTRWINSYIFRTDTFEFVQEFYGTFYDITRFDSRWVPEVDSYMDERFLVSCFPAGRGRPFDFGLIDRKKLYGPDWCGPQGWRCRVNAP